MTLHRSSKGVFSKLLDNNKRNPGSVSISWPVVLHKKPKPKKNIREGLLNKQGGFNANKGWRKRWVVFDGSKLSYYDSNKSQVSKRIIPVSCINNVEIDVKADNYKFKVFTTLKSRVFVFAAEKRDDCTMWANVLMAAVVDHKSSIKTDQENLPLRPDKEGFIRFANMKEYYVTITGQMLRYYHSLDDYQEESPVHEIDMKLASVKDNESKKLRLQLWVHYGHFDLIFPSEQELQQWRLAMEVAIAEGLADDTVLTKVYENISNQQCADCGAPNPHWASINLGIVVCKNCAGIHRMFDFRVTRIKSLRMDTRIWTPSLIELMVTIGNANANMFWAAKLPSREAIQSNELMDKRRNFISKKYIEKRYADKHPLLNLKPALGEELLKAAKDDNVLDTMRILFSGADIMYRQHNDGPTAFEIVKQSRQRLVMEFLFQNGGDPQSLVENVQDEDRLREDVRLQGFLNKTGPLGKTFERRWCVIEHGTLTYYMSDKTTMVKGSVDRKDMAMISSVDNDRMGYQFELSTTLKDNRTYMFSSDIKDDTAEWMGTIAKLMAPVAVMEHVGMIDIRFAGYAYMKELVNEWHQTFLVFSWRVLNFMNKDLKFDYLDLRKASSIRMQDANMGYQNRGPCFVISSTKWTVYLQANLPRDTEKMYNCLLEAITGSGSTLNDQVLSSDNVPVIVDRCITHVEVHGLMEKGVYRTAGQSSRVQALLDEFRRDALSVSLREYPVAEVANTLKRFLRELDDSVFERINYPAWISAAGCTELSNRLSSYEYYLKKMPSVHFNTLKRIILHLHQVAEHCAVNKMSITNLAACFAPSLMRTLKDQTDLTGDVCSQEIKIIVDLLENKDFFFHADEKERIRACNIEKAQSELRKMEELRQSVHPGKFDVQSWLVPCQILDKDVSVNVEVTETRTAIEAMEKLNEFLSRSQPHLARLGTYVLFESFFNGNLVRPMFPKDIVAKTTKRWMEFDAFVDDDITMSLSLRSMELLQNLDTSYQHQSHSLQAELQYSDSKSKKFKTKTVRFRQCQLAIYNKAKDAEAAHCWKVEDLTFYLGAWPKRSSSSRYYLTFLVNGEKYTKAFGHCLGFSNQEDLYTWAAMLYAVQNPDGLLSWASAFPHGATS
ncbi:hypothetical protein RRG08_008904 [Elysia crispata]|uniref:Arf-GAP with Rho-GAP domain, ANK repeat and PH domain-containing protein 1 n=1 Tax=Elysia crispata TaxID=231223 RepID=A0AAE0ZYN4_9GAST|nr:hypothetical protein RRG08_008904 [Elysia crispata]